MKKKMLSLILALVMTFAAMPALAFDTTQFTSDPDTFYVRKMESGMIITSTVATENNIDVLMFDHPYAATKTSWVSNNLFVVDDMPVLFILFNLMTSKALDVDSVSIYMNGKEYRFMLSSAEAMLFGDGYLQQVQINFGVDCVDFLSELLAMDLEYLNDFVAAGGKAVAAPDCRVVMHGKEDISFSMPDGYWTDLAAFGMAIGDMDADDLTEMMTCPLGTPCTVY